MVKATCFYKTICCIFLFTFMGLSVLADGGQKSSDLKIKQSKNEQSLSRIEGRIDSLNKDVKNISGDIKELQTKEDAFQTKKEIVESLKDRLKWWIFGISLLVCVIVVAELAFAFPFFWGVKKNKKRYENRFRIFYKWSFYKSRKMFNMCKDCKRGVDDIFLRLDHDEKMAEYKARRWGVHFEREKNKAVKEITRKIENIGGFSDIKEYLEDKFSSLEKKTSTAQNKVENLEKKLENLKGQLLTQSTLEAAKDVFIKEKAAFEADRKNLLEEKAKFNELVNQAVAREKANWDLFLKKERDENKEDMKRLNNKIKDLLNEKEKLIEKNSTLERNSSDEIAKARQEEADKSQEKIEKLCRENGTLEQRLEQAKEEVEKNKIAAAETLKNELDKKEQNKKLALLEQKSSLDNQYQLKISQLDSALTREQAKFKQSEYDKSKAVAKNLTLEAQLQKKDRELTEERTAAHEAFKREKTAEQNRAEAEKALGNERTQKENLAKLLASSENKVKELTGEMKGKEQKIAELQKAIYPSEFNTDEKFAPLKAHLEAWLSEKIPAAETVKSSLGLFAQRAALGEDIWQQALRSISIGITQSLQAKGASASEVFEELMRWNTYLMSFSDEEFQFSLKVPAIGASVDLSWMSVKTKGATRVSRILAWAVYNQYGVAHNAEVE